MDGTESRLHAISDLTADRLAGAKFEQPAVVEQTMKSAANQTGTRLTLILPSGKVLFDTEARADTMENHAYRPEFKQAMAGGYGMAVRVSPTLGRPMMYVIVTDKPESPRFLVRTAVPVTVLFAAIHHFLFHLAAVAVLIAVCTGAVSLFLQRRVQRPIDDMNRTARLYAGGELQHRVHVSRPAELAELAEGLNHMAVNLSERIRDISRQHQELETILSSMKEGVLVVGPDDRLLRFNRAAAPYFSVDPDQAKGGFLQEVIRSSGLQDLIRRTLASAEPQEEEIVMWREGERFLMVHGTRLLDANGRICALVVLSDITRLKRLEAVRREFVANVSHELKTPVTTIQGYVETLKDGALHDSENAGRFLDIIAKHAERLDAIIDDLLNLSRIEQDSDRKTVALEDGPVAKAVCEAVSLSKPKAEERGIRLECDCDESITAAVNSPLLEQAVANLVDNAIKYSGPGGEVKVECRRTPAAIEITVADKGCGIPAAHLPRIFERFYRVDKARSRELGGTGLGLAIVKHIVSAHGGEVLVESKINEGSVFTINLPKVDKTASS
jgi:two-component system phosphate regulon sensor histidine kinase PhoR